MLIIFVIMKWIIYLMINQNSNLLIIDNLTTNLLAKQFIIINNYRI